MCSCFGSTSVLDNKSKVQSQDETLSLSVSAQLKDVTVRIVHAGGRIEMYQNAILASTLIQRYPGMCIARPDVFKCPHESLLSGDDMLLPGHKYFVIRSTTVEKLKRRHSWKGRVNEPAERDERILKSREIEDVRDVLPDKSVCSAKDFFVSKENWSNFVLKKCVKEKTPFVPPIQRPRLWKEPEWEPSLTSIQELSP
ncbi:hypothetical protein CDL12_09957 [Handroanthus impetiginosus]|uniref:DUF4228 domain-containing protein n=1 Tax=Handroanthus impetiginosus TaxID=429701 RepID=A0A2G9HIN1_9LAMI|nr:hypothetical protein CDL12_09957 [Handroanthus impetiginosus]